MNKKAFGTLYIILIIVFMLIATYLFLLLPFPAFTKIRAIINYFLILILWIVLQVGLIFAYYKVIRLAVKGFGIIKYKILRTSFNIKKYIVTHS
jgi:hypothetical protein